MWPNPFIGKRLNHEGSYKLKIPVKYRFKVKKSLSNGWLKNRNGKKRARK